jgi:oligopeptide transport system substrate-binding protein
LKDFGERIWRLISLSFLLCALVLPQASCVCNWPPLSSEGVLNLWDIGPITLDPAVSSEMSSHAYVMQVFSGLVRLNDELEVMPDIAESWEESEDGKVFVFHLRHGVKFHDGKEVKAEDFKYSWERACDPETGSQTAATYLGDIVGVTDKLAGKAEEISGVEVVDDYTLQVTIDAPKAYFLCKLTYPTAFVVEPSNVGSENDWWRHPIGTGPFGLSEWEQGQVLILERNELYYGELPQVKQVVLHLLAGNPMAMYENGEIDVVPVGTHYIDLVEDEASPFHQELAVTPELSLHYIGFNTGAPPFDNVNVRRAFSYAVNKEHIIKLIFRDMVNKADGILPPGMPGYSENLTGLEYNVTKAKEAIAASEYGNISNLPPITITVAGYGGGVSGYLGAIIQGWRENLEVDVQVRQLESEKFVYHLMEEKDEMFMLAWVADYPDPHNFLDNLFYTDAENNIFDYHNPELDALLDQAGVEQNDEARLMMYQQAEQEIVDEAPCLPLCFGRNYVLVKPYVKGYSLGPLGIPDLAKVYIER